MTDREYCTGCGACVAGCHFGAIEMRPDEEGFLQPVIRKERCTGCGLCEKICPVTSIRHREKIRQTYLAYTEDTKLRYASSSGGIFTCLAKQIIAEGGVVFGCAMTEDFRGARHIAAESLQELERLRGAKYVQSDMGNILTTARAAVLEGRKVLFCGTPCQIAGLRALLGEKTYDNLLLVDLICHGVPSPLVWRSYVDQREKEHGAKACGVSFRDKENGWKRYSLSMAFSDGSRYGCPVNQDPYLRGFIMNLYSRRSCYHCKVKDGEYQSDITLGDFWGIRRVRPELENSDGVSVVITHTDAGRLAAEALAGDCCLECVVDFESALKSNPSYFGSVQKNALRTHVIQEISRKGTRRVLERYSGDSFLARCRRKLGQIFGG